MATTILLWVTSQPAVFIIIIIIAGILYLDIKLLFLLQLAKKQLGQTS